MPIPELRHADPTREGITFQTVVYDDLVDALLVEKFDPKTGEAKMRLFHEDPLIEISKNIDRTKVAGEPRHLSNAIKEIDEIIRLLKRQSDRAELLKRRLKDVRASIYREWQGHRQGQGEKTSSETR